MTRPHPILAFVADVLVTVGGGVALACYLMAGALSRGRVRP